MSASVLKSPWRSDDVVLYSGHHALAQLAPEIPATFAELGRVKRWFA